MSNGLRVFCVLTVLFVGSLLFAIVIGSIILRLAGYDIIKKGPAIRPAVLYDLGVKHVPAK